MLADSSRVDTRAFYSSITGTRKKWESKTKNCKGGKWPSKHGKHRSKGKRGVAQSKGGRGGGKSKNVCSRNVFAVPQTNQQVSFWGMGVI